MSFTVSQKPTSATPRSSCDVAINNVGILPLNYPEIYSLFGDSNPISHAKTATVVLPD